MTGFTDGIVTDDLHRPNTETDSIPLTEYCPKCNRRLTVNKGENGLLYFCVRHKYVTDIVNHQYYGEPVEGLSFPAQLNRFNWAAFIFDWIWAFARGLTMWGVLILAAWIIAIVPGILLSIWFGFNANKLDWENNNKYNSIYEFQHSHRHWTAVMRFIRGTLIFLLGLIALMIILAIIQKIL
ncbi:MAG TPA: hypothetical protein VGB30_01820 [bacterium]|jgi:hypothetical protein